MDKVKKITKITKKAWYKIDKKKLVQIGLQLITYFTKAKFSTSKVIGIGALIVALGNIFFPNILSSDIKTTNQEVKEMYLMYNELNKIITIQPIDTINIAINK